VKWRPIATVPEYRTVLLYRTPDLYPVVGFKVGPVFLLEENGPEDGEHRRCPELAFPPTHWAELPETPDDGGDLTYQELIDHAVKDLGVDEKLVRAIAARVCAYAWGHPAVRTDAEGTCTPAS
jgi:hypothetical protein